MQIPWRGRFSEWKIQHGTLHRRKAFNRYSNAFNPLSAEDGHLPWPRSGCKKRLRKQNEKTHENHWIWEEQRVCGGKIWLYVASQIGRNKSIDLLLRDSYSLGGWLGQQWPGQTVKYKNVSQLRCCRHRAAFVDSSSLHDVRRRGITYPENWERCRIWNGGNAIVACRCVWNNKFWLLWIYKSITMHTFYIP